MPFVNLESTPVKQIASYKAPLLYLLKFGGAFCFFYFGTLAIIGLSSPENSYSPFVADNLNFINPLRHSLLWGAKTMLSAFDCPSFYRDHYTLSLPTGEAVRMVYSCIGYGVMSFWIAFVSANKGGVRKKAIWALAGLAVLWTINIGRIVLLLLAAKKGWAVPFGWDHHTWFNIAAYSFIFGMIYFYDRTHKKSTLPPQNKIANQNIQALS